jgi:hypothetical protein
MSLQQYSASVALLNLDLILIFFWLVPQRPCVVLRVNVPKGKNGGYLIKMNSRATPTSPRARASVLWWVVMVVAPGSLGSLQRWGSHLASRFDGLDL